MSNRFPQRSQSLRSDGLKQCLPCEPLERRCMLSAGPQVLSSEFHFETSPHEVSFKFDQDVTASLAAADLILRNVWSDHSRLWPSLRFPA